MKTQSTLVLLKPDAMRRGLAGQILSRLEKRGLSITAARLVQMDSTLAASHYSAHKGKPFFSSLIEFITSGPLLALVLKGPGAVEVVRRSMGATDPFEAAPGTIRGDLAIDIEHNLIHGSDSPEAAEHEISLFFGGTETMSGQESIQ